MHVFHDNEMFSKFRFKQGAYNNLLVNSESEFQISKYYALSNALDALRIDERLLNKLLASELVKEN
jgi:ferredoxin-NADP reductase